MKDYSYSDRGDFSNSNKNELTDHFYNAVLVRHGSELGVKSAKTRKRMISLLNNEIYSKTRHLKVSQVKNIHTRTIVFGEDMDASEVAKYITNYISGVDSCSPIVIKNFSDKERVIEFGSDYSSHFLISNSSFGFKVRRTGTHTYTSMEMAKLLAERTYEKIDKKNIKNLEVNLTNPDFSFQVEIKYDYSFYFHIIFKGIDGLPAGSQGTLIAGIKPWDKDYLATALMRRRGTSVIPVKFNTGLTKQVQKQEEYFEKFLSNKEKKNTTNINLEELFLNKIKDEFENEELCAACDIFTTKIIDNLSSFYTKALGSISGDSFSTISPEFLKNLLNTSTNPIHYPLLFKTSLKIPQVFEKLLISKKNQNSCCTFQKKRIQIQNVDFTPEQITIIHNLVESTLVQLIKSKSQERK